MGRPTETLIRLTAVKILAILLSAFVVVTATTNTTATVASQALPGCDEWCGDLQIPYPFGTREGCYLNERFFINCSTTRQDSPKAFLRGGSVPVTNISISGELQILNLVAQECHPPKIGPDVFSNVFLDLSYIISRTKNKFIAMGCNTFAHIFGRDIKGQSFRTACVALCDDIGSVKDGACSGNGCCQLEIPSNLNHLEFTVSSLNNDVNVSSFNPCGYAFLVEQNSFNFSSKYIRNFPENRVLAVLDWAISNDTCVTAENKTNCICGRNSTKVDLLDDPSRYRCQCLEGFEGNPYLPEGCQDIDECKDESLNDCSFECVNRIGNYTCNCPKGFKGDGRRGGEGCTRESKSFVQIIVGLTVGFAVLVIASTWLYLGYRKWKFIKLKEKFFEKNGGLMLQQHLSQWQTSTDMVRIFTREELDKATNKYDESAVVGKGGYGTVYKGVLDDGSVVAIKKSKLVDQSQTSQFINEVIVLSQINHRNVVKLLGCCLETEVPLLVYEFITNGTLYEYVHDKTSDRHTLSWEARLRIASETAGVISYLHSSASTPIIHRDIKTTNILLDHNYTAKVSDFGASKLVPVDQTQLSTMVQGTLGYLDPEYLLTSELTEKSDVYSFGIVLLELITGKKAVSFEGSEVERNLAMYVMCAMKEDRLTEVVEKGIATEANFEQIKQVAKLATKCLRIRGEERPSMKEVAMELEGLRGLIEANEKLGSTGEGMVGYLVPSNGASESIFNQFTASGSTNIVDDSMKVHILPLIHNGR
ncbi:wall-associated receptor kinase 2-like [Benincasa hispida]|uniref:wall-associated receptor kinase 2-like n=1 Tax=Benincasa hispida TaxID=102211 RepID=UPI0019005C61|nr:wall-associated receptor kinase 2-like [Benincasa hispida]